MYNAEYRLRFADRVYNYFFNDGLLTPAKATARFHARAAELQAAIVAESARWATPNASRPHQDRLAERDQQHREQLPAQPLRHRAQPVPQHGAAQPAPRRPFTQRRCPELQPPRREVSRASS